MSDPTDNILKPDFLRGGRAPPPAPAPSPAPQAEAAPLTAEELQVREEALARHRARPISLLDQVKAETELAASNGAIIFSITVIVDSSAGMVVRADGHGDLPPFTPSACLGQMVLGQKWIMDALVMMGLKK